MISTTAFPGRYVQGAHAFKRLGREMARFGTRGFLICDPYVLERLLPDFREDIEMFGYSFDDGRRLAAA